MKFLWQFHLSLQNFCIEASQTEWYKKPLSYRIRYTRLLHTCLALYKFTLKIPYLCHMRRKIPNRELRRLSPPEFRTSPRLPLVLVLDNIRSRHNIGSAFRTSDAFALEHIYLCGITSCPPSPEIHKSALGAEDTMEWTYFENTPDRKSVV